MGCGGAGWLAVSVVLGSARVGMEERAAVVVWRLAEEGARFNCVMDERWRE
jgi:hypothetical protein